jgi:hypothetical protein
MGEVRISLWGRVRPWRRALLAVLLAACAVGVTGCLPPAPPPRPVVSIVTKPVDFGTQTGFPPFAKLVTVANVGNAPMMLVAPIWSGPDMSELSVGPPGADCFAPGLVLQPHEACAFVLIWDPPALPAALSGDTLSVIASGVGTGIGAIPDNTTITGSAT